MPEISKTEAEKAVSNVRWLVPMTAVSIVIVYLIGLTFPLVGPDEPRYAQVAREMFERSDWITPTLGGFNWFEKPALLYWLQIVSYNIFGVSEFAAIFGSAIFGLLTILALWILGHFAMDDSRREGSRSFANWFALIAASSIGLIVFSRGASFDIIITFPMTAALVGFFVFDRAKRGSVQNLGLAAFYFFVGVAMLAKGLIGIVFPYAIVIFYFLISRRLPPRKFLVSLIWGTVLALAVAAAWYLPMYREHGYDFVRQFFIEHHFQRYTSNKYFHPQPFYFFFWVLPLMTIPWLPFFGAALWKQIRDFFGDGSPSMLENTTSTPFRLFAAAWLIVPIVFFSFSGSKLPGYILPVLPAALMFTADFIYGFIAGNKRRVIAVYSLAMLTFAVVVLIAAFAVPRFADGDSVKALIAAADARGHAGATIIVMHTFVHNAEFYAAGRLLRAPDGRQAKLLGPGEVLNEIKRNGTGRAIVLVPLEYVKQVVEADYLTSEIIEDNGELAIIAVSLR